MARVNMRIGFGLLFFLAGCSANVGAPSDASADDAAPSCADASGVATCASACGVDADDVATKDDACVACTNVPSAAACLASCFGAPVKAACVP